MDRPIKKIVVLFSGGLDSTTVLYNALKETPFVYPLILNYGQIHLTETSHAVNILNKLGIITYAKWMKIETPSFKSALINHEYQEEVPKNRSLEEMSKTEKAPTYVPYRNLIMLAYAAAYASDLNAHEIHGGWNQLDYSGYKDCREEFLSSAEETLNLAGYNLLEIKAPLLRKTKKEIIEMGLKLEVPYGLTWSCYQGESQPCKKCDSCILRQEGFKQLGLVDPLLTKY